MSEPVIITAALTGVLATRDQCPAIPYTPSEIAEDGARAVEAGASILHIHARNDDGSPAYDPGTYQRIHDEVRKRCPDVIINFSTGAIGITREERIAPVSEVKPDMAALNMGSMNYAIYSSKAKRFYHDHVFMNPFKDIVFFLGKMREVNCLPEMEVFDTGHIHNANPLIDMGLLTPPFVFSFVMGVLGGIPATTENLLHQTRQLRQGSHWQAIVIGRQQWNIIATAIALGGNIRVGLEDNFYMPEGQMAESNADLVKAAAQMVRLQGRLPATVAQAREILGLKR